MAKIKDLSDQQLVDGLVKTFRHIVVNMSREELERMAVDMKKGEPFRLENKNA